MYLSLLSTYRVGSNYVMLRNVLKLIVLVRIFMVCVDHYQLIKIAVVANYSSVRQQLKILLKRSAYHLKRHLKVASAPSYRYMHPPQSHTFSLSCTTPPHTHAPPFSSPSPPPHKVHTFQSVSLSSTSARQPRIRTRITCPTTQGVASTCSC